jgi:hypothetical protein
MADESSDEVLEIRTYKIVPGERDEFHRIFRDGAVPMLHRHGITVVGYGRSVHDPDHYFLLRAYPSLERRQEAVDGFYGSDEWLQNYEDAVMPLIETYHTVVVRVPPHAIDAVKAAMASS